jgi:LPXTG-motif cell wall-anchored protein
MFTALRGATVPASRLTRITAVALATAVLGAPAASARPASEPGGNQPGPIARPVVQEIDRGFDTGSAALGAGGTAGILLLSAAGGLVIFRRRHHEVGSHDIGVAG